MGVSRTQVVKFIHKGDTGEKGEQGAVMRGPQVWSDCATGYAFQAGGAGEKWQDVVLYSGNYYSCKKSHTKTTSNYPGSTTDTNNGYWQLGDKVELVATKILMATYAVVENLGVRAIEMKDANGNILFQAKGGAVTCKTGTFENVNISGDLIVNRLRYNGNEVKDGILNCSLIRGPGNYVLPSLAENETMRVVLINPTLTRAYAPTHLSCEGDYDGFLSQQGNYSTDVVKELHLVGWYEFIGMNTGSETLWLYQTVKNF